MSKYEERSSQGKKRRSNVGLGLDQPRLIRESPRVQRLPELGDDGLVDVPPIGVDLRTVIGI